jgi:ubiquinone/menaquinone biosynthesis C-methylase UbiE
MWDIHYSWPEDGDEWSMAWGGAEPQWFGTLLPRIHPFLPTGTILEIAPGHGRWTHFLKDYCSELVIVDLGAHCIEVCKRRFAACSHITYHVNDGRSLGMLPDRSIDFAFSFDSLVHAEADVIESYLNDLARKLKPNGCGFIHHSHIGAYRHAFSVMSKVPRRLRSRLERHGLLPQDFWRAHSMTAQRFEQLCAGAGLACIGQELVTWNSRILTDAFSMFTFNDSIWARPNRVFKNAGFMRAVNYGRQLAQHYARSSYGLAPGPRSAVMKPASEAKNRSNPSLDGVSRSLSGVTAGPSTHDV